MKIVSLLPVSAAILIAVSAPAYGVSLSFDEARELLHTRSDQLKSSEASVMHARHEFEASKSQHGPKIVIEAREMFGRKHLDIAGFGTRDLKGPRAMGSIELPLYTGGAITSTIEAKKATAQYSEALQGAEIEQIDLTLVKKYFGAQLMRSVEKLRQSLLDQEQREVNKALKFEKVGSISKLNRMATEVNRDRAKRNWLKAQTDRAVAETELARFLREETIDALRTPLFVVTKELGSLQSWFDKAQFMSPSIKVTQAAQRRAQSEVEVARSKWSPQVYAFASKHFIDHYLSLTEPNWTAGVGVRFTLWDNRDRNEGIASARALASKADADYREVKNQLLSQVESALLRSTQAREQYLLTDSTLSLAKENLRLRSKAYREGLATADDLSEARTKLIEAEIERRIAAYQFVIAWATLHATAGDMGAFIQTAGNPGNIFEN